MRNYSSNIIDYSIDDINRNKDIKNVIYPHFHIAFDILGLEFEKRII